MWTSPERRSERCPSCAEERAFEQPPCLDGHEPGQCPEWACVDCGHAMVFATAETIRPARQLVTAAA
ncbi:hypothetical protein [Nonomuraea gerenzanensis]|uniref:hypothetical protein n=1 Tax=Nonomuraea gerenzanensis TaxID=93944 RepID=UPI001CD9B4F7|nr:hypothetical protein [Nonomuraea gerenzanensis]UBU10693.1 hypothetical protein LCN96_41160 [Nonomuraea gerenzanensis]